MQLPLGRDETAFSQVYMEVFRTELELSVGSLREQVCGPVDLIRSGLSSRSAGAGRILESLKKRGHAFHSDESSTVVDGGGHGGQSASASTTSEMCDLFKNKFGRSF